ncbi:MAG: bifunctional DNA primase/polymerase, partial [Methanogenium sp.]|nr:bifunctional DNA primase/polymerase [Methanogenium sp.]
GGNYGVMPAGGICVFDADNVLALSQDPIMCQMLNTFTVKSGRTSSMGAHFYFHCPELEPKKFILHGGGGDYGDIRGSGAPFYMVGPGSIHPSGEPYTILKDVPIKNISLNDIQHFISRYPKPATKVKLKKIRPAQHFHTTLADELHLQVSDWLMPIKPQPRGSQIEGNHPIHGGETGTNLIIDPIENVWYCRHHGTGGDALIAFAVAEGIISCEEAQPGCLNGHWPEVFNALKARGYKTQLADLERKQKKQITTFPRPGEPPQTGAEPEKRQVPTIKANGRHLHEVTDDAIRAISEANDPPFMFLRGAQLVRINRDEEGRPEIQQLSEDALRGIMDRVAIWVYTSMKKKDGKEHWVESPCAPPRAVVRDALTLPSTSWQLPPLKGLSLCPIIHRDGSIHEEGYDSVTQTHFSPEKGFHMPRVPECPTQADIRSALDLIKEVFVDFPFVDEAGRANAIGAYLTAVIRPSIRGPVPCWICDKPQAGAGASKIQGAVYIAATGETSAAGTAPKTPEEWDKRILAVLRGGRPLQILDNIEGSFASDSFASMLTAWEVRG